jgi:hypothetical protein
MNLGDRKFSINQNFTRLCVCFTTLIIIMPRNLSYKCPEATEKTLMVEFSAAFCALPPKTLEYRGATLVAFDIKILNKQNYRVLIESQSPDLELFFGSGASGSNTSSVSLPGRFLTYGYTVTPSKLLTITLAAPSADTEPSTVDT